MKFENPNIKPLMTTNKRLLASPEELITQSPLEWTSKIDLDYLIWMIANGESDYFYKLTVWEKFRPLVIERDKYECQLCKYHGKLTVLKKRAYVHHIAELKLYPQLALNGYNLATLCHDCHEQTHDRNWNAPKEIEVFENFDDVETW